MSKPLKKINARSFGGMVKSSMYPNNVPIDEDRTMFAFSKFSLFIGLLSCACLFIALSISSTLMNKKPIERVFAVNEDGVATDVLPLNVRSKSDAEVIDWASKTLMKSFSLTASEFEDQIELMRDSYTDIAFKNFKNSLVNEMEIIEEMKSKQLFSWAKPLRAPVLLDIASGVRDSGIFWWKVRQDFVFQMAGGGSPPLLSEFRAELIVERAANKNTQGIAVSKLLICDLRDQQCKEETQR